ncbi:phosphatidylinositol-glycan biosynthesis class S protein-domain-containing protein [Syncephalis pseudoplumigaleata]|uniref:Phosphatidylinositol-glycan biosynthesis class S protein-domain-containing protein n=1 Tax=Syncephalis pseudoplumigaleata TaxID=1712513 RepID=A0A4P9Z7J5_9FUNG|nr:phosphatidylinositol-glycan biosynthesis class S protein-domain-containing protein [Syncephalis pseudoplumigaleata]|eukprot:RKP27881.1 phosphatidylinositol-glycan biosynthesis class S protein-domain-containing protein [Syncephalis pseudoplumigaleata]
MPRAKRPSRAGVRACVCVEFKGSRRALRWQRRILGVFCGSLLLGVPLWWRTTRVYRASLPLPAIDTWNHNETRVDVDPTMAWQTTVALSVDVASDELRVMPPSRNYQVMFSLMNEDPRARLVNWEIEPSIRTWLGPFFRRLSPVANATLLTQVQHYATLEVQLEERASPAGKVERYLPAEKLGNFINSAEWNLASVVSNDPTIHMLVYTPSPEKGRIYVLDEANATLPLNAFLIPQWGGIVIENAADEANAHGALELLTVTRLKPIMEVFLSQLRDLLGVRDARSLMSTVRQLWHIDCMPSRRYGVTGWELDSMMRRRLGQRIISAITTLQALARLVTSIESMPIGDHIKTKVYDVLEHLSEARQQLAAGDLAGGFQAATRAAELAEAAFFDHTMVAQLYFPDEHKFAVYMPLFVPIGVPMVLALLRELKQLKKGRKTPASDADGGDGGSSHDTTAKQEDDRQ